MVLVGLVVIIKCCENEIKNVKKFVRKMKISEPVLLTRLI